MQIQLMADGGADLPKGWQSELNVKVVPLYIRLNNVEYTTEEIQNSPTLKQMMRDTKESPQTSAPSPGDFYDAYQSVPADQPIIMISLSEGLSATYDHALLAKNMLLEEEPHRKIHVINSRTATCGVALLLHEANKKMKENYSFHDIVAHLNDQVKEVSTLFVLKTLENLILGGRLSRVKGKIAEKLNVKLLMHATDDGKIEVTKKVRGDKKSLARLIEQIGKHIDVFEDKILVMSHFNAKARAEGVLERIKDMYPFKSVHLTDMGPLISTYAGEGGLVISFFDN